MRRGAADTKAAFALRWKSKDHDGYDGRGRRTCDQNMASKPSNAERATWRDGCRVKLADHLRTSSINRGLLLM